MRDYKNMVLTEPLSLSDFFSGAAFVVSFIGLIFFLFAI